MADDILHIKDSYYFEVPRFLWPSHRKSASEFPSWMVRLDDDYQQWESKRFEQTLQELGVSADQIAEAQEEWKTWTHKNHSNSSWPLDAWLDRHHSELTVRAKAWAKKKAPQEKDVVSVYLSNHPEEPLAWVNEIYKDPAKLQKWKAAQLSADSKETLDSYLAQSPGAKWDAAKIEAYNKSLNGKIFIPQPFGTLKNAYEPGAGFCISRYMLIELAVALLVFYLFRWLAGKMSSGDAPKGKLWNALEGMVTFVRNQVVVPAMGEHDADKYMPFFWTLFTFILGCNLAGMIPWVGAPTSVIGTTGTLAIFVFLLGLYLGIKQFGLLGYLKNICPSLGLPPYLAIFIVPLLWVIEAASLLIKHFILAMRLLANMVAGHSVLLGIMGMAFGAHALTMHSGSWSALAIISLLGTTALSFLELFVAFLQAYIFTFLAALFVGSAIHHH
jgi:F-type H+-transporting ATPase subunit a